MNQISSLKESLKIVYKPNCECEQLEEKIISNYQNDIRLQTTSVGPHRDDMIFEINGYNAGLFASQGQQRTAALSLKLGLTELLKKRKNEIIIILDDVFGELDLERQTKLIETVNNQGQIFITTTDISNVSQNIINKSNVIYI